MISRADAFCNLHTCYKDIQSVSCKKNNQIFVKRFLPVLLLSIIAFVPQVMFASEVDSGTLNETVTKTHFDAETIKKGFTLESHDKKMRLGIRPDTLNVDTRVDVKTLDASLMDGTYDSFVGQDGNPNNLKRVGNVYLFDILNKVSYDGEDFFFLEVKYPKQTDGMHGKRRIYFYNAAKDGWQKLPSYDSPETNSVRALIHLPYARLAIFEEQAPEVGGASWYGYKHCLCAASPDYPKGSELVVSRLDEPDKTVTVTVNDYGPDRSVHPNRVIDLDKVAYKELAPLWTGLIDVRVEKK